MERGSVSGLFVCLVTGLMSLSALAFDGGRVVDTYVEIADVAAAAARAGGQQIDGIREGSARINRPRALTAVRRFLGTSGSAAEVSVTDTSVTVTLRRNVPTLWLGMFGVGHRSVTVTRSAGIVQG